MEIVWFHSRGCFSQGNSYPIHSHIAVNIVIQTPASQGSASHCQKGTPLILAVTVLSSFHYPANVIYYPPWSRSLFSTIRLSRLKATISADCMTSWSLLAAYTNPQHISLTIIQISQVFVFVNVIVHEFSLIFMFFRVFFKTILERCMGCCIVDYSGAFRVRVQKNLFILTWIAAFHH